MPITSTPVRIPDPTIRTAFVGDEKSEDILHFGSIKLRVNGTGNLMPTLYSLDDSANQILVSMVMSTSPGKEPVRLSNFLAQRASLELKTTVINEIFRINRIILFVKPIYSSYPA
jgi:hypothetical protein